MVFMDGKLRLLGHPRFLIPDRSPASGRRATLPPMPEAVAYIAGDVNRSVSGRLICRGPSLEALRTAHTASPLLAPAARPTCATASPRSRSAVILDDMPGADMERALPTPAEVSDVAAVTEV